MKYICLGYHDETAWEAKSADEQQAFASKCFAYDDMLFANSHLVGGEGLQDSALATTLRSKGGKISMTDGPFIETKEQLGGIMMLEAKDLNHAIQLLSKHPSLEMGTTWEIRPSIPEITKRFEELKR